MASFEQVVKFESEKPKGVVRLVEANGFYRAYNQSAYLFHQAIAKHKVTKKFVKNINQELVYIGFPADRLLERIGTRSHKKTEFGYDVELAAECYALGLDPADAANDFRIVSTEMVDGEPNVEWEPKMNRWTGAEIQAVLKGAATLDGEWKSVEGATAAEKAAMRFFKVVVEVQ